MRRFLFSACIAGLTLSVSPHAFADESEACDMLCRLRGYLATDHMAPAPTDAAGPRAGAKHGRSAAAPHKSKLGIAAVPAASAPKVAVAKPAPAAKTAEALPKHLKTVSVADTKPAPSPSPERHRSIAKAAPHPTKTAVAAKTTAPATPEDDAALPAVAKTPSRRVPTRVAMPTTLHVSSPPPLQTATAADMTTSPTAAIPAALPWWRRGSGKRRHRHQSGGSTERCCAIWSRRLSPSRVWISTLVMRRAPRP